MAMAILTNSCLAASGFSEEVTSSESVISMPEGTTKGLFSPRSEGVKPLHNILTDNDWFIKGEGVSNGNTLSHEDITANVYFYKDYVQLIPSRKYTLVYYLEKPPTDYLVAYGGTEYAYDTFRLPNTKGLHAVTFTTKSSFTSQRVVIDPAGPNPIKMKIYGIYEGDQTNNPNILQPHNYGLIPCAQNYELESRGKNKFDIDNSKYLDNYPIKATYDVMKLKVKPSTDYYIKPYNDGYNFVGANVWYLAHNVEIVNTSGYKTIVRSSVGVGDGGVITSSDDGYIYIGIKSNVKTKQEALDLIFNHIDIQLEEGTTATAYEPYTESKTEFSVPEEYPLVELPNGIKNENGEQGYRVNVGKVTLPHTAFKYITTSGGFKMYRISTSLSYVNFSSGCNTILTSARGNFSYAGTLWGDMTNTFQYVHFLGGEHGIDILVPDGETPQSIYGDDLTLYYQLETPFTLKDGENGYKAPSSLQSFQGGDLVIMPVNSETSSYNDRITIRKSSMPIERLTKVNKLRAGVETLVDISKVHVASDGLSFTIDGAENGDIYTYNYEYPSSMFINPTIKFSTPINREGQVNSTIDALDKQNKQIEYILEQLKMIQSDLDEIKGSIN